MDKETSTRDEAQRIFQLAQASVELIDEAMRAYREKRRIDQNEEIFIEQVRGVGYSPTEGAGRAMSLAIVGYSGREDELKVRFNVVLGETGPEVTIGYTDVPDDFSLDDRPDLREVLDSIAPGLSEVGDLLVDAGAARAGDMISAIFEMYEQRLLSKAV